tara:strand:- start:191 stop:1393 length:1203 start_codon:yes stop_codon:yes gene_type:complete
MDDYNVNVLSEAKNEYSSRLVTILTPLMLEGVKSIFDEASKLCLDNDEEEKYLMTFQNFLSRVPKWNSTIIDEETKRIITKSSCSYLEDLLTCVHITQLKILTSIRVSQKQKKIDIDIPKLNTFIHRCYITFARKLYSNVYLFESNILPLNYQKNMREAELMCQESILKVIRDNMPVEKILRAYIDETVDEEVIEETIEKEVTEIEKKKLEEELSIAQEESKKDETIKKSEETVEIEKPKLDKEKIVAEALNSVKQESESVEEKPKEQNINLIISTPKATDANDANNTKEDTSNIKDDVVNRLSFNDTDSVVNYDKKTGEMDKPEKVEAPKTLERLEKIAFDANEKRKAEEAEYDDDDDDEKLQIFGEIDLKLDNMDIHNLDKKMKIEPAPILNDVEVLG